MDGGVVRRSSGRRGRNGRTGPRGASGHSVGTGTRHTTVLPPPSGLPNSSSPPTESTASSRLCTRSRVPRPAAPGAPPATRPASAAAAVRGPHGPLRGFPPVSPRAWAPAAPDTGHATGAQRAVVRNRLPYHLVVRLPGSSANHVLDLGDSDGRSAQGDEDHGAVRVVQEGVRDRAQVAAVPPARSRRPDDHHGGLSGCVSRR